MSEKIKVKVILGSVRQGRFGERPANWLIEQLKEWKDLDVELLDLKDYPMPFFDSPVSPAWMNMKYDNPVVQKWSDKIKEADAYIMVSPEYNHGYSSVLKNAIDWLGPEWGRKPVGFVSYGSASGARVIEQLKEVTIELNMVPMKRAIGVNGNHLVRIWKGENLTNEELFADLRKGPMGTDHLAEFVKDLVWMAEALRSARSQQNQ